jgi:hypothetical protein
LDETRKTAQHALEALRGHEEYVRKLRQLGCLDSLEAQAPEAHSLTPDQRHQWYELLKLRTDVIADGRVDISWTGVSILGRGL